MERKKGVRNAWYSRVEGPGGWVRESLQGGDRGNDSWKLVQLRGREQFYHNNEQGGAGGVKGSLKKEEV